MIDKKGLKILIVSEDRSILTDESASAEITKMYGEMAEEVHIVLLSSRSHHLKSAELSKNVFVYPTNSINEWFYKRDGASMGKRLVKDKQFVRGLSVISANDPYRCGEVGLKISHKWRLPLEVEVNADDLLFLYSKKDNSSLIREKITRRIIERSDSIRVGSDFLKNLLMKEMSVSQNKISVLPVFIDPDQFKDREVTFDVHARFGWQFIMLMVASLEPQNNISTALEVLSEVRKSFPRTGLVVVGEGREKDNLLKLAAKLGVEQSVAFINNEEPLGSYYKTSNAYLNTSSSEASEAELIKAGLSGLPVVTTPVGFARDLQNGKQAIICPVGDVDYMSRAVYDLIDNNQLREILRSNIKTALDARLISREEYENRLRSIWQKVSAMVQSL
jgi:glycosyltransferase involved in cell wall biosynthesis